MKVIVTGSRGFVGRHLVRALEERRIEVVGYDIKEGVDLAHGDWAAHILDQKADVIVHLASSCSSLGSINDPMSTFRDTVRTAATVADAAARGEIPMLLTSSVKARDGMTPYGAAKRMVETWMGELSRTYGFPLVVNRPGTIYGPEQEGSLESGWIAWFLRAKRESLEVTINGSGNQIRDLLYVDDYVELLVAELRNIKLYAGATWDVGGGADNIVSVKEMADWLGLRYTFGPPRYGDADIYVGLNDVPGWEPRTFWQQAFRGLL